MKWILGTAGVVAIAAVAGATMYRERTEEGSIDIAAPPDAVWRVLTDFDAYPQWNPFVLRAAAPDGLAVDRKLDVRITNNGSEMSFTPTVLAVDPGRELRWIGRLLFPGVIDGEHYFRIETIPGGSRFTQGERFTGVLVPVAGKAIDVADSFAAMNEALRDRVLATIAG